MSINLKAIREAEAKAAKGLWSYDDGIVVEEAGEPVPKNRANISYSDGILFEDVDAHYFYDPNFFFVCLARNEMPKLLDWIERAKKIIETATSHECHRVERKVVKGRCGLCTDCEALALLAELEPAEGE